MDSRGLTPETVRQALDRVLGSAGFARNPRMSRFLRFLVERSLDGDDNSLKEAVVGMEVFGRRPDYDPKQDSIVRTEASRLRARLIEYYAGEGRHDLVTIDVPKGGYAAVFHASTSSRPEAQRPRGRPKWIAPAMIGVAALLAFAGWRLVGPERPPYRIAVLPFQNLGDSSNEYFADGLTDEIIRHLSIIDGLSVRSQTSSFVFKGQPRNVRDAGRQLEADYLVEGSILRDGAQVRINAQLVRARDDALVWSGRFDRMSNAVVDVQDEISRGIVNQLRLRLGQGRRRYETSAEAYDAYLRARAEALPSGTPGTLRAIADFERAITRDESFAPAYAGLAAAYAIRSAQFPVDHAPDELAKMRSAAQKAIDLDPLLPEAYDALALVHARQSQWTLAEHAFKRAIDLDPNASRTLSDYATWLLYVIGRNAEALELMRRAQRVDPLSADVNSGLAWLLMTFGRYDEADRYCTMLPADDPFRVQCLGRVRLGQARMTEALEFLEHDPALARNPQARGFLGYAYARAGRREEAEKMAAAATFANEQALIYAGLGDKDRTLAALEQMTSVGVQRVGRYLNYPELGLLRGDPRLDAFRRRVGLAQ